MAKTSSKKITPKSSVKKDLPDQNPNLLTKTDLSLNDLFVSDLKAMYWAENHLVKSIPKMVEAAGSNELKKALQNHWKITKGHASRLEKAFEILGIDPLAKNAMP